MEETNTAVAEPKPEAPATPPAPTDGESRYRRRAAFLGNKRAKWAIALAILVLLVLGFFAWHYFASYESTDDAQVDGHVNSVSARVSGHVTSLNVEDNQYVEKGTGWSEMVSGR